MECKKINDTCVNAQTFEMDGDAGLRHSSDSL
jgi:hypothetical protein